MPLNQVTREEYKEKRRSAFDRFTIWEKDRMKIEICMDLSEKAVVCVSITRHSTSEDKKIEYESRMFYA